MSNPPRQKGTREESAIVNRWNAAYGATIARRTPASSKYDVRVLAGVEIHNPIELLVTRADRGERLVTLRHDDFMYLFMCSEFSDATPLHIESKRYKRFSLHSIFESKFGKKP